MMSFLVALWNSRAWIGYALAGVILVGAWITLKAQRVTNEHLANEITRQADEIRQKDKALIEAARVAAANKKAIADMEAANEAKIAATEAALREALKRANQVRAITKEIAGAPAKDDGPVAPVLGRTLDSLRNLGRAASPDH